MICNILSIFKTISGHLTSSGFQFASYSSRKFSSVWVLKSLPFCKENWLQFLRYQKLRTKSSALWMKNVTYLGNACCASLLGIRRWPITRGEKIVRWNRLTLDSICNSNDSIAMRELTVVRLKSMFVRMKRWFNCWIGRKLLPSGAFGESGSPCISFLRVNSWGRWKISGRLVGMIFDDIEPDDQPQNDAVKSFDLKPQKPL